MGAQTVLVLDDDELLGRSLARNLSAAGFACDWTPSSEKAIELASRGDHVAGIFDRRLPGLDGLAACRAVHELNAALPVMIISGADRPQDIEECIASGARDFLTKPFEPRQLIERLQVLVARTKHENRLSVGPVTIDMRTRDVAVRGRRLALQRIRYELFLLLARRAGRTVTTREISELILGRRDTSNAISVHISAIRAALGRDRHLIETAEGGYRLNDVA
ncbi:MAG: response regulator transcription factor [Polyangiaceae bacterium]